jgi:branched-chain amino acid transport system permease protein
MACDFGVNFNVISVLLGGLAAGMVLYIVSVGLSVTMGLMGFVNLAHGAFAMVGGYVIIKMMQEWNVGFAPAVILGALVVAAASVALERLIYRPLYKAGELYQVLLTIGLVFVIMALITLAFGPTTLTIQLPKSLQGQTDLGFVRYPTYRLLVIAIGIAMMVALWLGFERTTFGAKIRAAVDNRRMAESLGIDVNMLFTATFAAGSGLAAMGGALGADILGLDPQYALKYLAYFLIVVAVGGLGRVTGVFVAAAIIGVLDFALKVPCPKGSAFFIYAITIAFLLWRPQGLFGKA